MPLNRLVHYNIENDKSLKKSEFVFRALINLTFANIIPRPYVFH